jgi:ketosteroid isomerase-like protein
LPRAIVLILIGLCGAARLHASADPHSEAVDSDESVQPEKIWNDAHLKGDAAALERPWSDDMQIIAPKMPMMTRSDAVSFARSGRMEFEQYATSHLNVRRHGDAMIVTGEMKRSRRLNNGQLIEDNWQFTKVYVRKAGGWQFVIFQASEAPAT